ncbi:MAG: tripartite tricarboxylate transporter substrate binding protein [Burkholderiales bacterium]|nr:tripartite tricarboxylate transporter substrate binding protein [Burkholderiales bacterium]
MFQFERTRGAWILGVATAAVLSLASTSLLAQQYPNRSVRLVVTFPPGGFTDTLGRVVAGQLAKIWNQNVIVDNRPGASGMIGADFAAKSAPDGYTILIGTNTTNVSNHMIYPKVPYGRDAFAPVLLLASISNILVVSNSIPPSVNSIAELVAYAKTRPGKITYATPGHGLSGHLGMVLFSDEAGIDLVHVPFRGGALQDQALIAGEVNLSLVGLQTAVAGVKSGKLRPLANAGSRRLEQFPDLPTFAEAGYRNVEAGAWFGLMVPAGTPQEIIDKIHRDAAVVLNSPEFKERMTLFGATTLGGTPEDFTALIRRDRERWESVIKRHGIRAD